MNVKKFCLTLSIIVMIGCDKKNTSSEVRDNQKPNILIIYMDDLGYGDVGYNGGLIPTPNINKLADSGIIFRNAYASSATCTPSRYALLTGMYPWRKKDAKILPGTAPLIIGEQQQTLPKILKNAGYYTGIVGKWHLGLGDGEINWNDSIKPGPNEIGFQNSFIMAATQDRVPTVYIQNGSVYNLDDKDTLLVNYEHNFENEPTGLENPELVEMKWHHGHNNSIVNGIPRIGFMKGGQSAKWTDIDMSDKFLGEAQNFIRQHKANPFFLYYSMNQPHVPRTPNPRFIGASGMGPRGDAIVEADWSIGQLIQTLKEEGVYNNTFIIFSSDNGPVLNDGYYDSAVEKVGNHQPSGNLRGGKYSLFDAGTHVPFITAWEDKIKPGYSNALISQLDIISSIAELVGENIDQTDGEKLLDTLLGKDSDGRENIVLEATSRTCFRMENWVMIPPYNGPELIDNVQIETGNLKDYQLYDLSTDPEQSNNLATSNSLQLEKMIQKFNSIRGEYKSGVEALELK